MEKRNGQVITSTIFKGISLSLFITTIWTIIAFFIFLNEEPTLGHGVITLAYYLKSCWVAAGLGIICIFTSLPKRIFSDQQKIFLLILVTILNLFFLILFVVLVFQLPIRPQSFYEVFIAANLIIPGVSIFMLYRIINGKKSS